MPGRKKTPWGCEILLTTERKNDLQAQMSSQVVLFFIIVSNKLPQSVLRTDGPLVVRSTPISRALRACFLGYYHMAHISQEHFDKLTCSWM